MKKQAPPPRRLTAAERTLSLYTGKTDTESPRARDGSYGEPKPDAPRRAPNLSWKPLGIWAWERSGQRIDVKGERFELTSGGRVVGTYPDVIAAGIAADAARRSG